MITIKRKCDVCGREYDADYRNLQRGWGLCCSKSCAAKKRELKKTARLYGISPDRLKAIREDRERAYNERMGYNMPKLPHKLEMESPYMGFI